MPIIGMTFDKLEANRTNPANGEIKVNSAPKVVGMREVTVETINKKAIDMQFEFRTSYAPNIGEIVVGGSLLYLAEKNLPILKQWKSKKTIPENVSLEVLNHLFRHCLLKIANLADDLQLPPPLQLPTVKPAKDK